MFAHPWLGEWPPERIAKVQFLCSKSCKACETRSADGGVKTHDGLSRAVVAVGETS
jgi:hypothetical protein